MVRIHQGASVTTGVFSESQAPFLLIGTFCGPNCGPNQPANSRCDKHSGRCVYGELTQDVDRQISESYLTSITLDIPSIAAILGTRTGSHVIP